MVFKKKNVMQKVLCDDVRGQNMQFVWYKNHYVYGKST